MLFFLLLSDMAAHLSFLLIFAGFTGIQSQNTVTKVSVPLGGSITIPCLYSSDYRNHVKYLCKGYYKMYCSFAVKTNQESSSEKFLISDDPNQGIFTVTIKDLTTKDNHYWCFVEIDGGSDVGQYFQLSVTRGMPSLFVTDQEIMGFYGKEKTINCCNSIDGKNMWCKLGRSCVMEPSGSIDGTKVTIVTSVHNVFNVTMSGLRTESSGWYLCAKGDFQMPVHVNVTVNEKPYATTATATATATNRLDQDEYNSASTVRSISITLSLLIFIVIVALIIWFIQKHKQTKADSSATTMAKEEVTYSSIKHKKKMSDQQAVEEATYHNVDYMRKASGQVEAENKDVTYSTLAQR